MKKDNLFSFEKRDLIIFISLFIIFFFAYFLISLKLNNAKAFSDIDLIFNTDVSRVINNLEGDSLNANRVPHHPLFILLFNPLGSFISTFFSYGVASVILTSIFSGLSLSLFYLLLRKFEINYFYSSIFTLLLGFSSCGLVFGPLPESFIFSAASLIGLFLCYFIKDNSKFFKIFFIVSIFSVGIITINIIPVFIVFFARLFPSKFSKQEIKNLSKKFFIFFSLFLIIFLTLFSLQVSFSKDLKITNEKETSDFEITNSINLVKRDIHSQKENYRYAYDNKNYISEILPHFFIYNIISQDFFIYRRAYTNNRPMVEPVSDFNEIIDNLNFQKIACLVFYLIIIFCSLFYLIKFKLYKDKIFISILAYLLFTIIFHSIYSVRFVFIFYMQYTFSLIAILAYPFKDYKKFNPFLKIFIGTILILFLICLTINNSIFIGEILEVFKNEV